MHTSLPIDGIDYLKLKLTIGTSEHLGLGFFQTCFRKFDDFFIITINLLTTYCKPRTEFYFGYIYKLE